MHRFQISVFGAIAIVFSVQGVNQGLFVSTPSLTAMGVGWLLLAVVNILWVLYFTSEEDSLALHIFNGLGNGGLSSPSHPRTTHAQSAQSSAMHHMPPSNGYAFYQQRPSSLRVWMTSKIMRHSRLSANPRKGSS